MRQAARWLVGVLLVAGAGCVSPAAAASSRCAEGPGAARVWAGDFDGDGNADRLWLQPPGGPARGVEWVRDPWKDRQRRLDAGVPALVLAHGGTPAGRCTLIQHRSFFSTPIWEEGDPSLSVLPRADGAAKDWRRVTRGWRGDGILLGTEAGVDVLLYWDGRRYRIAYSGDVP